MPNVYATPDDSVLLLQLTDSHLFAEEDGTLHGMNTAASLEQVVRQALAELPAIDLLLATGDLSQDGTAASYQRFAQTTACIKAPKRWLAGNHDEPAVMQQLYGERELLDPVTDMGNWRVVMLDSTVPGSIPGVLSTDQLRLLEDALADEPSRHHLVCLHHHPVSIGCAWMEPIGLRNAGEFFEVTDRYPQVRAILWGHVHQEWDTLRNGVRLLASPSTCIQFAPRAEAFALDRIAPGYRWLRLHPDGNLETGVVRVPGFEFSQHPGGSGH
ncbi:3',5'-cyclic-AMP phosphodiesterase [Pseudomonas typographi]|uniref:3',5'-cyclic-AMP phosphodiesterase n=1 Tax=Pseudomonas typographi TaxID=2715964 RepID=UPI0016894CDD|nr:3',5'-cyclic-AMP phosphodiesterase [Pseudomonas typographi]MBD1585226.1 3',5'-cyclic-AMP phosphodiesterase [Pseudomonas typographi]